MDYMIVVMKDDYKNIVWTEDLDYVENFAIENIDGYDYIGPIIETDNAAIAIRDTIIHDLKNQNPPSRRKIKSILLSFIDLLSLR